MKNSLPLVSIIIPAYNAENYLNQAINSALAQTYENIEVIVINDGSNDHGKTAFIARSYGKKIRYYEKENGGVATALNLGIEKMNGQYFSWLSHDDMYTPNKIHDEINILKEYGEGVAVCNVLVVGPDGTVLKENKLSSQKKHVKCFLALDTDTGINGCSLLIPKKAFEDCGKFKPELKCTQDYDMWFRIAEKYPFFYTDTFGVLSRQHDAQDSRTKTNLCTQEADKLHSYFLKQISTNEMRIFLENNDDYLAKQMEIYFNAGYLKTAAQIFTHIWMLNKNVESPNILPLFSKICGYDDMSAAATTLKKIQQHLDVEKNKPTIIFYSNVWTKGGIERVLSVLFPQLVSEYQIILISNHIEKEKGFSLPKEVLHIKVGADLNEKLPFCLLVLSLMLKADIFVGNPNIIYTFLDVYPLLEECGIRTVACNHGYYFIPYWSKWIHSIAEKRKEIYPKVSAVTWLTSFSTLLGHQISDNSILMPNPNTYPVQKEKQNIDNNKNLLIVGRFYDEIKRVDRALKVFRKVIETHPDAKLYLVGGYDLEMHVPAESPHSLNELIKQLDFPDESNLIWVGETEDPKKYYEKASILMLTSANEGFSMVLNEAGVFGMPQVLFDIPGLDDLVTDGENGYLVQQDDIGEMADKIIYLFEHPDILKKMSIQAQKKAARYDINIISARWKTLFSEIIKADENLSARLQDKFPLSKPFNAELLYKSVHIYENQMKAITNYKDPEIALVSNEPYKEQINNKTVVNECTNCRDIIYQSNSWKVTKPLRWISLTIKSLKKNGIKITLEKIQHRFQQKFKRSFLYNSNIGNSEKGG